MIFNYCYETKKLILGDVSPVTGNKSLFGRVGRRQSSLKSVFFIFFPKTFIANLFILNRNYDRILILVTFNADKRLVEAVINQSNSTNLLSAT